MVPGQALPAGRTGGEIAIGIEGGAAAAGDAGMGGRSPRPCLRLVVV
jgi:hypothetical protein